MTGTEIDETQLPPGLLENLNQDSPIPVEGPAAGDDQDEDDVDVVQVDESELEDVQPTNPMDTVDPMLAGMCGDAYADVLEGAVRYMYNVDVQLPDDRLERRGYQIAYCLRRAGWDNPEIILAVTGAAGIAGDISIIRRELDAEGALDDEDQEDDDE